MLNYRKGRFEYGNLEGIQSQKNQEEKIIFQK